MIELRLQNSLDAALKLYLEPWGETLWIPPTLTYRVVAKGPEGDSLHIEVAVGEITVYGWPGSVLSVFHSAEPVMECRVPVPSTPQPRRILGP
jgi:hypothetical protein